MKGTNNINPAVLTINELFFIEMIEVVIESKTMNEAYKKMYRINKDVSSTYTYQFFVKNKQGILSSHVKEIVKNRIETTKKNLRLLEKREKKLQELLKRLESCFECKEKGGENDE